MFLLLRKRLVNYSKLNLGLTLRLSALYKKNGKVQKRPLPVKAFRKVRGRLGKGVEISGNGLLDIGLRHRTDFFYQSTFTLANRSKLILNGSFKIFTGCKIEVSPGAELELGSGSMNNDCQISCYSRVKIGHKVAIGEGVRIWDSDGHSILHADHKMSEPIEVGDHVWIGINSTILKGVKIGNGAVIAAGSLVNKDVPAGTMVGGVPAKIIRKKVEWKY